jgi:hypothetical protein
MIRKAMRFWSEETGQTALLVFLSFEMFLLFPLLQRGVLLSLVNASIFSLLLLAGLLTITRHPALRGASALFVALFIAVQWLRAAGIPGLLLWDVLFSAVGLGALTVVVLWAVLREGPVTAHRIRGAIAAYLLLAVFFAYVYGLIEYVYPGSLRFPEGWQAGRGELHQGYLYFSVVTITTLGYGDITPIHPWARSAVMLEAIIGPLYLAILVARLVSLGLETGKPRPDDDRSDRKGADLSHR